MPFKSIKETMHEWKTGSLHSGKGGPVVKSQRQALAIALSMQRRARGGMAHTLASHTVRRKKKRRNRLRKVV